ncbi:MAG: EpsI family protein [Novosphingobium sp.]|nr:EpsI family protein [Novosphingobium sp.]
MTDEAKPGSKLGNITAGEFFGSRREVLLGGALLATAGLAFARIPRTRRSYLGDRRMENEVPKQFDGWFFEASSGLVLPPSDQLRDTIYSQLLTRVYQRADGAHAMLLVAYSASQDGMIQVHRPEVCYPASGYRLVKNQRHEVQLSSQVDVPSRYIVAETDTRREQMIYWTRLGRYFPDRWMDQRVAVAEENLSGIIPDGVLVRISTLGSDNASGLLDAFAASLYRAVSPAMRQVLCGETGRG